jgi:hypothetical protein
MSFDWKTSLPAWIAALAAVLKVVGVDMGQDVQNALVLVLIFVIGLFATSRGVK